MLEKYEISGNICLYNEILYKYSDTHLNLKLTIFNLSVYYKEVIARWSNWLRRRPLKAELRVRSPYG